MAELMLVNPRKRRTTGRKKARTPAQKAATRRLVALNKKRSSPRRKPRTATTPVRRRRRAAPAVARRVRRYKRNPAGRGVVNTTLIPAAIAASGALGLDILWGFAPVPANLKAGPLRHVVKGAGAIGMGWLAGKVVSKRAALQLTGGALTVIMHDAAKELVQKFMPQLSLGYYSAGQPVGEYMGEYTDNGMGEYMPGNVSEYLSNNNLSTPFAGPSATEVAYAEGAASNSVSGLESEHNSPAYY